jgi:hypothetical protein
MTRYILGLFVGATGALIGVYAAMSLLPATREERPRDPLPGRRDPNWWVARNAEEAIAWAEAANDPVFIAESRTYDTWTSGPIT